MPVDLYPGQQTIPEDEFFAMLREVQLEMAKHAAPSLSEVYFPNPKLPGVLENGTGSFADVNGIKLLVSNDHVIGNAGLHHSFPDLERYVLGAQQRYGLDYPIDIGASKIEDDVWSRHATGAFAVPFERFALRHETHHHEILWTAGYPGARVKHLHEMTFAVAQALPTQEHLFHGGEETHEAFNQEYHFALGYNPDNAQRIDSTGPSSSPGLSDPHGLSGSLVWNTRRLECFYEKRPWDPSQAFVTGIVWGAARGYLIATKVEHLRDFLLEVSTRPSQPPKASEPQS